jgi:WD40 repeat protein/beta-lactamase regulating signal transducer with metallopeptidase domain
MFASDGPPIELLLADLALKTTLVLVAALAVTRALRRASAATRHHVWVVAVLAVLMLPVLGLILPGWGYPVSLFGETTGAAGAVAAAPASGVRADEDAHADIAAARRGPDLVREDQTWQTDIADHAGSGESMAVGERIDARLDGLAAERATEAAAAKQTKGTSAVSSRFAAALPVVWTAGCLLVLAMVACNLLIACRAVRNGQGTASEQWQKLAREVSRQLGIRRPMTVLASDRIGIPMAFGHFRPVVLLPRSASQWSIERLRAVLLHEASHIKRHDVAAQMVASIACAVYWWHPLVWLAAVRMRTERQRACDDLVLLSGIRPSLYASHLLEIARSLQTRRSLLASAPAMAHRSAFRTRITAILDGRRRRRPPTRRAATVTAMVAALLVISLAVVRPTVAKPEPGDGPTPPHAEAATSPADTDTGVAESADRPAVEQEPAGATSSARTDLYGDPLPAGALIRLGTMRLRQMHGCVDVAFNPAGSILATTAMQDEAISLWDTATGKPVRRLRSRLLARLPYQARFVAFSPDGRLLVSVGYGRPEGSEPPQVLGLVQMWDVTLGTEMWSAHKHKDTVTGVAFNPNGLTFATGDDGGKVLIWDSATGRLLRNMPHNERANPHPLAFSPDGQLLASGVKQTIRIWNLADHEDPVVIKNAHGAGIGSLAFGRTGERLFSSGCSFVYGPPDPVSKQRVGRAVSEVHVWDTSTGKRLGELNSDGPGLQRESMLAISEDGGLLATTQRDRLDLWDPDTQRLVRTIRIDTGGMFGSPGAVAISAAAKRVAASWGSGARVWDSETGKEVLKQTGCHVLSVFSASFSPDGRLVATGGRDCVVHLWNAATGRLVRRFPPGTGSIRSLWFTPDGQTIIAGRDTYDAKTRKSRGEIRFLETATGKLARTIEMPGGVTVTALSRDGKRFAAGISLEGPGPFGGGGKSPIHVWELESNEHWELRGLEGSTLCLAFDGRAGTLVCVGRVGRDGTVRRWNIATGEEVERHELPASLLRWSALSPDSRVVFFKGRSNVADPATGDHPARIIAWDLGTGQRGLSMDTPGHWARLMEISPSGRLLAAHLLPDDDSIKNHIALYETSSGRELLRFDIEPCGLHALAFSPDERRLISCPGDGAPLIWDITPALEKLSP